MLLHSLDRLGDLDVDGVYFDTTNDVAVAGEVGLVSGLVSPWVAMTRNGAILLGAASNVAQYLIAQSVDEKPVTTDGLVQSLVVGGIAGAVAGAVSPGPISFSTHSPWIDPAVAQISNLQLQGAALNSTTSFLRNLGARIASNWNFPQ